MQLEEWAPCAEDTLKQVLTPELECLNSALGIALLLVSQKCVKLRVLAAPVGQTGGYLYLISPRTLSLRSLVPGRQRRCQNVARSYAVQMHYDFGCHELKQTLDIARRSQTNRGRRHSRSSKRINNEGRMKEADVLGQPK